ncbi:MAG: alcohol dehydrogenase family protein [Gammaproteobacteria bacterium]|nr:alcohol dehydrogenase family protein [Gammaproteobacteria bacterium]
MTIATHMTAVQLVGHGGLEQLQINNAVPVPTAKPGEVLIKVGAAGINNTDINTRIGWYSKQVTTDTATGGQGGFQSLDEEDASWSGIPLQLPRIQGADVCGKIVAVGDGVDASRIGERVLVRALQEDPTREQAFYCITYGSECDGGFAEYAIALNKHTYAVNCDWSDAELASIPCAYSTAENMLHRAHLKDGETVLITGASGGVGSAAVQLAKRRGARVIALCSAGKAGAVAELGADLVLDRAADIVKQLGRDSVDMVIDLVAGPAWAPLLDVLKRGGRYSTAGAIAGPIVELDVRTLYLKDLTLRGSTYQEEVVFSNLIGYIDRGEIQPVVSATYPLTDIHQAQEDFLAKGFVGKLVLIP